MTIVVESSQWTGEYDDAPLGSPIVWGEFPNRETLDSVAARLQSEPWFRDTTARMEAGKHGLADNDQLIMPDENPAGTDARNLRQNFVGLAAASTSMLAAGIVISTGGAALPAVAAAVAAGVATAAVGEAAGLSLNPTGTGQPTEGRKEADRADGPALGIHVDTDDACGMAEAFLQSAGARRVWVQRTNAG
jgi:hypothetical protein